MLRRAGTKLAGARFPWRYSLKRHDLNESLNGCMILIEKVLSPHTTFNRLFIDHYCQMKKRKGYSDLEIAQKREALENVLVPYHLEENQQLLRVCGFQHIDVFFKWYNFCGILAIK